MRIEHKTYDDFVEDLRADVATGAMFRKELRLRTDSEPDQKENISQSVQFWATYVRLRDEEDTPAVVELNKFLGSTLDGDPFGIATEINESLCDFATSQGVSVRPGKIEFA